MFVFFSDGILDARNRAGDMFGRHRTEAIIAGCADISADCVVKSLFKAATEHAGGRRSLRRRDRGCHQGERRTQAQVNRTANRSAGPSPGLFLSRSAQGISPPHARWGLRCSATRFLWNDWRSASELRSTFTRHRPSANAWPASNMPSAKFLTPSAIPSKQIPAWAFFACWQGWDAASMWFQAESWNGSCAWTVARRRESCSPEWARPPRKCRLHSRPA